MQQQKHKRSLSLALALLFSTKVDTNLKHSFGSSNQKFNDFFPSIFFHSFYLIWFFFVRLYLFIDRMFRVSEWERKGEKAKAEMKCWKNKNIWEKWSINWIYQKKQEKKNQRYQTEWIENRSKAKQKKTRTQWTRSPGEQQWNRDAMYTTYVYIYITSKQKKMP